MSLLAEVIGNGAIAARGRSCKWFPAQVGRDLSAMALKKTPGPVGATQPMLPAGSMHAGGTEKVAVVAYGQRTYISSANGSTAESMIPINNYEPF